MDMVPKNHYNIDRLGRITFTGGPDAAGDAPDEKKYKQAKIIAICGSGCL